MRAHLPVFRSRKASLAYRAALVSLPVLVLAILLFRLGRIEASEMLAVLAAAFAIAFAGLVLGLWAAADLWRWGGIGAGRASAAIVVSLLVLSPAFATAVLAALHPQRNDVATRADPPLAFQALVEARRGDGAHLEPPSTLAEAAPRAVRTSLSPERAFAAARQLADERGWSIAGERAPGQGAPGRFEASARTPIFGFPDDMVVEIAADEVGARVDMRSASRFGEHDLGQNARRVTAFLRDFSERAGDLARASEAEEEGG